MPTENGQTKSVARTRTDILNVVSLGPRESVNRALNTHRHKKKNVFRTSISLRRSRGFFFSRNVKRPHTLSTRNGVHLV